MDGSFAIAFLLVAGMFLSNLGVLFFGLSLFVLRRSSLARRVSISAVVGVTVAALAWCSALGLLTHVGQALEESRPWWMSSIPESSLSIAMMTVLALGNVVLLAIVAKALRSKGDQLWSFAKWLLVPAGLLHLALSGFALYVVNVMR